MSKQSADKRGGDAQSSYVMPLHQRPKTIWAWIIRRAIVKHHGRSQEKCSEYQQRPQHPADVGDQIKVFGGMQVETEPHVLRAFDRETAMRMHGAFWHARG